MPLLATQAAELERVHKLGVTITETLSWSPHIQNVSCKVRKLLGLLFRQFYGLFHPQQFMKLYSSIVLPHTEYPCQVWNPHLNIEELENTQKMVLRICTRLWDLSYGDLLLNFKILTLAARHELLSLCTLYNIRCFSLRTYLLSNNPLHKDLLHVQSLLSHLLVQILLNCRMSHFVFFVEWVV